MQKVIRRLLFLAVIAGFATGCRDTVVQQVGPALPPSGSLVALTANRVLVFFKPGSPGTIDRAAGLTGIGASDALWSIDFGVPDGLLYSSSNVGRLYQIDLLTGTCLIAASVGLSEGTAFDPVVSLLRVVGTDEGSGTVDVYGGFVELQPDLSYAPADANFGVNPAILEIACTNQAPGAASTTVYGIDRDLNVLVTIDPASGQVHTVGPLGITVDASFCPFDIAASGDAYLASGGKLYMVDLATGAAKLAGAIGIRDLITGLAVVP